MLGAKVYGTTIVVIFTWFFGCHVAQAQSLGRFVGGNFVVEDRLIRFHINRSAGGQIDYLYNKTRQTQYLRGNGYYYLAGTGADSFGGNYYQSYDQASNFRIIENNNTQAVIEVAGNLVTPPVTNRRSLGVAYLRRYTYRRDSMAISVSHALRFDTTVRLNQLSATLDVDEDVNCRYYSWGLTEYWMGAARSWRRFTSNSRVFSGLIDYPSGFTGFDNLGRMFLPARANLAENKATIFSPGRGGISREFQDPRSFQSITFWTNPKSANLRAKSLEAHFLNTDAKWVLSGSRDGSSFNISQGTVLRANEVLRISN